MTQVLCPSFIGRASEQSAIRALLHGAASGSGGTVAIVGEQGVGKSRLLREAAEMASSLGITVLTGRGVSSDRTTAFRPITEALFGHFRNKPVPDHPRLAPFQPVVVRLVSPSAASPQPVEPSPLVVGESLVRLLSLVLADRACLLVTVLQERRSGVGLGLNAHRDHAGDGFDERRTGLDHLSFQVGSRADLEVWRERLDSLGVEHSGITDVAEPFPFSVIVLRDPDAIQLELISM